MSGLISILLTGLVFVIIYQIAKASEYATILRGEEKINARVNRTMAILLVAFFLLGLYGIWVCHEALIDKMLPVSASEHGVEYDRMFLVTLAVTGIVFLITQTILFWFAYRYQSTEKRTSFFYAHNNKLELVWTTIPAIAMAVLVAIGLRNWMNMTSAAPKEAMVVEVVGKQFNWIVRYPGKDGVMGKRDFRKINDANNVLGLDWNDKDNMDDVVAQNGELHLVVNKPVSILIGSRDVIHDVGLPHFRMKMDAVPGIVTTIWFTPTITTTKMKEITGNKDFVYEISCDQMCGKGHYSMRGTVIVETQAEYDAWMAKQQSYYASNNAAPAAAPAAEGTAPEQKTDSVKAITMK
ncbi:MAG: cytochrome c oxidase subunit II [Flavipsychrobacter sp.]|nr:cytochrome c oxidase subunit II [Flavipsychrobacter sp.]